MIVELFSASPNFKFSERTFYILWNERQCVARIEAVVLTQLIPRSHDVTSTVGKQVVLYPLPRPHYFKPRSNQCLYRFKFNNNSITSIYLMCSSLIMRMQQTPQMTSCCYLYHKRNQVLRNHLKRKALKR